MMINLLDSWQLRSATMLFQWNSLFLSQRRVAWNPSQIVMKENPRNSPRVPPNSARSDVKGYRRTSVSILVNSVDDQSPNLIWPGGKSSGSTLMSPNLYSLYEHGFKHPVISTTFDNSHIHNSKKRFSNALKHLHLTLQDSRFKIQYLTPELLFGRADSPALRAPLVPWKPTASLKNMCINPALEALHQSGISSSKGSLTIHNASLKLNLVGGYNSLDQQGSPLCRE